MDLLTIKRAIELAGDVTPAAMALYRGFIADTQGATQEELQQRYAGAQARSDQLHDEVQATFGAG